jgi:hypothetical protein
LAQRRSSALIASLDKRPDFFRGLETSSAPSIPEGAARSGGRAPKGAAHPRDATRPRFGAAGSPEPGTVCQAPCQIRCHRRQCGFVDFLALSGREFELCQRKVSVQALPVIWFSLMVQVVFDWTIMRLSPVDLSHSELACSVLALAYDSSPPSQIYMR